MMYILYATILDQDSLFVFDRNEQFECRDMEDVKDLIKLIKFFTDGRCKIRVNVIDESTGETVMEKKVS